MKLLKKSRRDLDLQNDIFYDIVYLNSDTLMANISWIDVLKNDCYDLVFVINSNIQRKIKMFFISKGDWIG